MANLGTPTVIGTLTNSTSTTTYTVPIAGLPPSGGPTALGDCIVIVVGSGSGGSFGIPTSVTDSQGQTYTQYNISQGSGTLTYWQIFNSKVLSNTDTITVQFPTANTQLKNIVVLDCPGAVAIDQQAVVANTGSTSSASPSLNYNASYPAELIIFAQSNGNAGGSPTSLTGATSLTTLHSGSGIYTTVGYQLLSSAGANSVTDSITGVSTQWGTLTVGLIATIPLYVSQQPFSLLNPALDFNPATQFRSPPPQPPVPTVISSAPINITGAQSNVYSNGVNFLKGDASSFNASVGNWTNGGNTTQAQTNAVSHNAQGALQATATSTGSLNLLSSTSGKITTTGMSCLSTDTIFVAGWVLAAATPRTAQIGVSFLDSNANVLGTTFATPSITDSTGVWQLVWGEVTGASFPTAAWARVSVQWSSVVATEVHYVSDVWMFNVTQGSGMGEQIQIFTPNQPSFQLQPAGIPYPLSLNPALQFLPRQTSTALSASFLAGSTGNVTVAAPAGTLTTFQPFALQFPFPPVTPLSMQVNPSLSWLQPQHPTANTVVYIDGGTGGQVSVNANFPDINVTVSVSAVSNVSVAAPSPVAAINGVTANVNVVAPLGTETVAVVNATSTNISVAARAGSLQESLAGTAAHVNVSAVSGTVTITPPGPISQVNVAAVNGSVRDIITGSVANVNVASTGVASVAPLGVVGVVNVSAPIGSVAVRQIGTAANVNVVSRGSIVETLTGTTAAVSVAAVPGSAGQTRAVAGPTANVSVSSVVGAAVTITGTAQNITVSAPAGSVARSITGLTATVSVASNNGFAGIISITGTLFDSDTQTDQFLSDRGKLLYIPVANRLISADPPPQPQGI